MHAYVCYVHGETTDGGSQETPRRLLKAGDDDGFHRALSCFNSFSRMMKCM